MARLSACYAMSFRRLLDSATEGRDFTPSRRCCGH
ncbi:hypothetical protein ACIP9X_21765 [Arthrobacter sp. NPDC093125]